VLDALARSGADVSRIVLDPAMVRGLEYYTGTIFEGVVPDVGVGSVVSGGRYDNLVGSFGRDMPAVGLSFGVDRLIVAMDELALFPDTVGQSGVEVLVARFDEATTGPALAVAASLRRAGLRVESYLELDRLGDQIRYALRRGIPLVAILGPDEAAAGTVTLRDLRQRLETAVPVRDAADAARARLAAVATPESAAV
jgi:histidyl-tRNA synthetase